MSIFITKRPETVLRLFPVIICLFIFLKNTRTVTDQSSATSILAMRQSSKNILYTVVNSRAYDKSINTGLPTWQIILYVVDALLIALIAFLEYRAIKTYKNKKKAMGTAVKE